MNFSRFRVTLTCSLLAVTASAYAQTSAPGTPGVPTTQGANPKQTSETAALLPESDDDIPVEVIPRFDNAVSFGLRRLTKGPRVKFGNLGHVEDYPYALGTTLYYANGTVQADAKGNEERYRPSYNDPAITDDPNETPLDIPNGTKLINLAGATVMIENGILTAYGTIIDATDNNSYEVAVGKSRTYTADQTRYWSYTNASQLTTRGSVRAVGMSSYSAQSLGATAEAEGGPSSGFELKFERRMGRLGAQFEYGFGGGFSLGDINGSQRGTVASTLVVNTQYYQLFSTATSPALSQPSGAAKDLTSSYTRPGTDGAASTSVPYVTTAGDTTDAVSIGQQLFDSSTTYGTVNVEGVWKLKGAYYLARLGPIFRYRFTERIAISGSAGLAIAWVGTQFRAEESLLDIESRTPVSNQEENETHKFVPGWYGELNAEYWLTERTGFYGGVSYQKMGDYTQRPLSGRTAKVDLGSSPGFQFGLVTRF